MGWRTAGLLYGCLLGMLWTSSAVYAGHSNSLMDISHDGRWLACSNRDAGTLSVVDLTTGSKLHEIEVGLHPEGVTFLGHSLTVAVAVYGEDRIDLIDVQQGNRTGSIDVYDEPYGVVSNAAGDRIWVTLEYPGQVIEIDPAKQSVTRTVEAGKHLRGLAVAGGERLLVTEYITGVVKAIDLQSFEVVEEWKGSTEDSLARQITTHPTFPKAYLPHQRSLVKVHHGNGSIFPYLGIVNLDPELATRRTRKQMDSFRGVYVVANPWEVAVAPDGERLYIVFSGTDDLFVCQPLNDNYREVDYLSTIRTGANPRAVKVAPDSKTFYVYSALDFTVTAFDSQTLRPRWETAVTSWSGDPEVLLGKKLFYTAHPPMTRMRWISCSSCHPDGDADGLTWQQPDGLRSTQPLFGMKHTHPIHWSADRDEVQDFEHTIRSPLMGGQGLVKGRINPDLGKPNAGLSRELDALAAYTNSHEFKTLSPYAKQGLSAAAQRGRTLFLSSEVGCAKCHSGPYYTDNKMYDVGTSHSDPSEKLGPEYDTPTLLGIYRSAPYLHHGKARTLEDLLTTLNPNDQHGRTSQLSKEQIADLVEFLKALPYELP